MEFSIDYTSLESESGAESGAGFESSDESVPDSHISVEYVPRDPKLLAPYEDLIRTPLTLILNDPNWPGVAFSSLKISKEISPSDWDLMLTGIAARKFTVLELDDTNITDQHIKEICDVLQRSPPSCGRRFHILSLKTDHITEAGAVHLFQLFTNDPRGKNWPQITVRIQNSPKVAETVNAISRFYWRINAGHIANPDERIQSMINCIKNKILCS